ncbi:recombinase family protein [Patescibacteria group bacterium]|nr:recombinase family protein [Patescibacteria group bacterium]
MNKFFIYCRKSSEQEDRQVLSLPGQARELQEYAKREGLTIVDTYQESKSAHWAGRIDFNNMLMRIRSGEGNGIIVWDESRIARNALDSGTVIYMIDLQEIVEIRKPGKVYKNTPDDKSWLAMCFMMSKKESDDKGVSVKRGLKTKAEKGYLPSGAKAGYMNDKYAEKGNKTLLVDPVRFPLIKKTWEMFLTGIYSPPQVLNKLNDEWGYRTPQHKRIGGKPMTRSQIYKTLADPFYYGVFEYPEGSGNWYQGKHEPMITKDEFDRAQMLLGKKGRPRPKTHDFTYTGLLTCGECGAMITAEEKYQVICPVCKLKFASLNKDSCPECKTRIEDMIKPTLLHYTYYHCTKRKKKTCSQLGIRLEKMEAQIEGLLSRIQISERFKNWAIKYLNELNVIETEDRDVILKSQQEAYDDVVKRIDNLIKLKISPQNTDGSLLSDDDFKRQKEDLMKEKSTLQEKLGDTDNRINKWVELSEKTFNFACHARYWFANGDTETKKQILMGIGSNLTLKDKTVLVDLEKPLQFIEEAKNEVPEISPMFEPTKKGLTETQLGVLYSQNPTLLPSPKDIILPQFEAILKAFTNPIWMGEMRVRWNEIKKLSREPNPALVVA